MTLAEPTPGFADRLIALIRATFGTESFIPLHAPRLGEAEATAVADCVRSGFVSSVGNLVSEFEHHMAAYTGAAHAVATVNGTAALHLALRAGGAAEGTEVLTPSATFIGSCNAIRYCGAWPVFLDIDRENLGIAPDALQHFLESQARYIAGEGLYNRRTGRRIAACLAVNLFGHPARLDELSEACQRYDLPLIEDAAESLGSYYQGVHTGRFGRLGTFSFNGNKIVTTGGGGCVVTDSPELAERVRHWATTAKLRHPYLFIHDDLGYNYRLPALNAALGIAQLDRLADFRARKRKLAATYQAFFDAERVAALVEPRGAESNYWLNAFFARDRAMRDSLLAYLNDSGVMARPIFTPMHTLEPYRTCFRDSLAQTEQSESQLICVPSSVVPS